MSLGGFAENKDVLDGTEETYIAYNYCLAESYISAIWKEDFDEIEDIDDDFIRMVAYWLNYDGKIGENIKEDIQKMLTGELITCKNRQFIYGIIDNNQIELAFVWLCLGNRNIDLIVYYILNDENSYKLINNIMINSSREEIIEMLSGIVKKLNELYSSITDPIEEKEFLSKVKDYLYNIRLDKSLGEISFGEIDSNDFIKEHVLSKNKD